MAYTGNCERLGILGDPIAYLMLCTIAARPLDPILWAFQTPAPACDGALEALLSSSPRYLNQRDFYGRVDSIPFVPRRVLRPDHMIGGHDGRKVRKPALRKRPQLTAIVRHS